jgi:hypothetical protein
MPISKQNAASSSISDSSPHAGSPGRGGSVSSQPAQSSSAPTNEFYARNNEYLVTEASNYLINEKGDYIILALGPGLGTIGGAGIEEELIV